MTNINKEIYSEFFQIFSKTINSTLVNSLDEDTCDDIQVVFNDFEEVRNPDEVKDGNVVYSMDFVIGQKQARVVVLVQEELISSISDIQTGGSGKRAYKGSLSEIETNSVSRILTGIFNDVENAFQNSFDKNLVFGTTFSTFLKEAQDYSDCLYGSSLDLLASADVQLSKDLKFKVKLLFNGTFLQTLMEELGYSDSSTTRRKERYKIDLDCLSDVSINVTAELGRTQVPVKFALELTSGSIVELDTQNNADIKVFANGLEFAYAQVVAIEDSYALKITKIISQEERMRCL